MSPTPSAEAAVAATAASRDTAVAARGLTKRYGRHVAVAGLDLDVRRGEVFGLLGPNGAGKTTTVKMLLGLVRPSAGTATLDGRPVSDPRSRRRVGYLPEHFRFPEWATGRRLLDHHGRLSGLDAATRRERIPQVLARVGLGDRGDTRLRAYSKGMQQRIGLAQALLGDPAIVLLDEPTSALDPIGRRDVRDLIRGLRADDVTVVLNSHLLSEVEMVCDRVAIVDRGRVVTSGALADVVGRATAVRLRVDRVDVPLRALLARSGTIADVRDREVLVELADPEATPDLAAAVVGAGYRLEALVPVTPTLEDVFVRLVTPGDG